MVRLAGAEGGQSPSRDPTDSRPSPWRSSRIQSKRSVLEEVQHSFLHPWGSSGLAKNNVPPSPSFSPPPVAALRVEEGDGDVASPFGGGQALVVMRQAARVQERPALPGGLDGAVVADEAAAPALQGKRSRGGLF